MEAARPLITPSEAEEVVLTGGTLSAARTPMMVILALVMTAVLTLVVIIFLSLRGANTGLGSIFPFLTQTEIEPLQISGG